MNRLSWHHARSSRTYGHHHEAHNQGGASANAGRHQSAAVYRPERKEFVAVLQDATAAAERQAARRHQWLPPSPVL
jgi:hypothetical protein